MPTTTLRGPPNPLPPMPSDMPWWLLPFLLGMGACWSLYTFACCLKCVFCPTRELAAPRMRRPTDGELELRSNAAPAAQPQVPHPRVPLAQARAVKPAPRALRVGDDVR